jgi:hypothetical protein
MISKSIYATGVVAVSLVLAVGCGGGYPTNSPAVFENNALSEIGEIYRLYTEMNKKPPQSLRDFAPFREGTPNGIGAAARGEVVVLWGAKLNDLTEEGTNDSPDEVLAYLKEVPEKGGLVLMKNRKIKSMTPEEFKAAPKAGTESPPLKGKR